MNVGGQIRKGAYFDSVTLMRVGTEITALPGVIDAAVVMGTKSNRAILNSSGLLSAGFDNASDTDLLVAVKGETETATQSALAAVDGLLKKAVNATATGGESRSPNLAGALKVIPDANLALMSESEEMVRKSAARLMDIGGSSGADLGTGFLLTVRGEMGVS